MENGRLIALTKGPATDAIPYIPPSMLKNIGLFAGATVWAKVTIAPVKMPALPSPAIARPTIKVTESGATPQMREPSSKTKSAERKTHLMLKRV